MTDATFIQRHRTAEHGDGFAELRRLGIELAQQFSGELWTDFNLHDPGVTILEQLVYALTELGYRAELPVEDLLCGDAGIDYRQQALYAPERIFPCRPTTLLDYRKLLLNAIGELDNCWLQCVQGSDGETAGNGLYRLLLKLGPDTEPSTHDAIRDRVRDCYGRQRNLCEDIAEIVVMREIDFGLCACVEVQSARRPADILAEIYFTCARQISGQVVIEDFPQAMPAGQTLDRIFEGPWTDKGRLDIEERSDLHQPFVVSTLYPVIKAVEGVDRVDSLYLERHGQRYYDTIDCDQADAAIQLRIPQAADQMQVLLILNDRVIPVAYEELRARYDELKLGYYASRATPQDLSLVYELPTGVARDLTQYYSIQNQFPVNYGIGRYGIPDSAAPQVKARARQLKGYLLLFEQIMANYLANLDGIKGLYSIDKEARNSYSFRVLDKEISGVHELYPGPDKQGRETEEQYKKRKIKDWIEILSRIVNENDHYHERKSRLLDYLLALYGESFTQHSLQHFDCYYQARGMAESIVTNKIDYLASVVELGRDKAMAGDYRASSWHERATTGLHLRVGKLLGFRHTRAGSLIEGLLKEGLKLARHSTYKHLKTGTDELSFIDIEAGELLPVTLWEEAGRCSLSELREIIDDSIPLSNNLLSDMLLRGGVDIERFRLFRQANREAMQLCFRTSEGLYWHLGDYPDVAGGIQGANALQRLLIHLNLESEGFHLIEHILLRPLVSDHHEDLELPLDGDFFAHRISLIFPGWTTRCRDLDFRLLAEETVRLNLPAHLYAEFYWLGFHEMYEWENLYSNWLDLKSRPQVHGEALDRESARLLRLLLNMRGKN